MKKTRTIRMAILLSLCLLFLTLGVQAGALAEEVSSMPSVSMSNIKFTDRSPTVIKGSFDVKNLKNTYEGNISYVTEVYRGTDFSKWELINKVVVSVELFPNETKTIYFKHDLPKNISSDSYHMIARVLTRTGLPVVFIMDDIGDLEGSGYCLNYNSGDSKIITTSGEEKNPLSGPSYDANQSPKAYVIFTNPSAQVIKAYPQITVYNMSSKLDNIPVTTAKAAVEEFQPGQTQKIMLSLPVIKDPGSYQAVVSMIDENGIPVSGDREYQYVIKGASAKILNMDAYLDANSSKIFARAEVIGPADESTISKAEVEVIVYNDKTNEEIKKETKTLDLGPMSEVISLELSLDKKVPDLRLETIIKYESQTLDTHVLKIPGLAFVTENPKPLDVIGTTYEYAVGKLIDRGIINGYQNGTFKPEQNITRAEFAKVVCLLLGKQEEVEKAKGETKFKDVKGNHWATGHINVALENKLIKGYPGGEFKPGNNVTYAEAVTILIRAMGYGNEVDSKGKWPDNYISKAEELGLASGATIDDFSATATRGTIAILTWNTFEKNNLKDKRE